MEQINKINGGFVMRPKFRYYQYAGSNQWYKIEWDPKKPWMITSIRKFEGIPETKKRY